MNHIWCFQVSHRDVETEKRLRKDLKRTKALLADAQIMLDHLKNNAPSKREIAQLKNQVCFSAPLASLDNTSYMRSSSKRVFVCVLITARGIRVHMCCCSQSTKVNGSRDRGPPCPNGRHIQIQADGKSVCVRKKNNSWFFFFLFSYYFYIRVRGMHGHRHHLSSSTTGGSQDVISIIYHGEMISAHNGTFPIPALIWTGCIAMKCITL